MPGQQQPPARASSYGSLGPNEAQNAALLGATAAFGRAKPMARAPPTTCAGANGALATATSGSKTPSPKHASRKSPSPAAAPPSPSGSTASTPGSGRKVIRALDLAKKPNLAVPTQARTERSKSPSHQAAQLAVARSPEPHVTTAAARPRVRTMQRPSVAPKPRRLSERHSNTDEEEKPTDTSPMQPTTSLVDLFERRSNMHAAGKRPQSVLIKPSRDLALRSPKPVRVQDGGITSMFQMELERPNGTPKPAPDVAANHHDPGERHDDGFSSDDLAYVSASEDTAAPSPPSLPLTIWKRDSRAASVSTVDSSSLGSRVGQRSRLSPSPLRHSSTQPLQIQQHSGRSVTSPPLTFSGSSQSGQSIAAQYHQLYPRRVTPLNNGDALANAIVASSLASSRAPSPHKMEPPPLPASRRKHHKLSFSRTPSPTKQGMRHTMRKAGSSDSESEDEMHPYGKHKKKRLVRKHPNKHHEGDRKRWRDAVTERERKRYEGVWAANKGMHCSFTLEEQRRLHSATNAELIRAANVAMADQVSNIVARDMWSRSRLPDATLELVWDLVDNECVGRLSKEEFVVGMWLVDLRLKGRKLPVKVSETVWASVRSIQGIKIRK
ncbi:hypothetical protein LTR36_002016 [Oleoguttula mirabilis]|uniref:EH domain-containing protein n=1 Tax=Oleoguttula mirabilis TaxID=1507867 RepID=A0AAV9JMV3_9PEZI|nr:hypothetical protein LTR36_002016 [Oleoguttula mirabilis]